MFYRRPEQMVLTFSLPAVICILLGSIFSTKLPHTETSTGAVIAASMLAYGILSTSFINLGISIAADRDTGALKTSPRDADDRIVVFHRKNSPGRHRQPRRGHRLFCGGAAVLRTSFTHNGFRMVHADVGVPAGDRQLLAAWASSSAIWPATRSRPPSSPTVRRSACSSCRAPTCR